MIKKQINHIKHMTIVAGTIASCVICLNITAYQRAGIVKADNDTQVIAKEDELTCVSSAKKEKIHGIAILETGALDTPVIIDDINLTATMSSGIEEKTETDIEDTSQNQQDMPDSTKNYVISGITSDGLNSYDGTNNGPSGMETYYNLDMDGVVEIMRSLGYSDEEYPYWVRDDGVKMFGDYVMVAANLDIRPKGTVLDTSMGTAIVVDTGDFAKINKTQIDIATSW